MRIVTLAGLGLALTACAAPRTVTFIYYPNAPRNDTFPRQREFAAEAHEECAKYGLAAVHTWDRFTRQRYDHGPSNSATPLRPMNKLVLFLAAAYIPNTRPIRRS